MIGDTKGNLFIGVGVTAKGTLSAPGFVEVDGVVEGSVSAQTVHVTANGVITGTTTADNIRVAGQLLETSTAHQSLLVESTGRVAGTITYRELEILKGGTLQGDINSHTS